MSFCKHGSHTLWLYSLRRVFQPLRKSGLCFSAEAAEKQLEQASCKCVYISGLTHVCLHIHNHALWSMCIYLYVHISPVCVHACITAHLWIYVQYIAGACVHDCVSLCTYVLMCVCLNTWVQALSAWVCVSVQAGPSPHSSLRSFSLYPPHHPQSTRQPDAQSTLLSAIPEEALS